VPFCKGYLSADSLKKPTLVWKPLLLIKRQGCITDVITLNIYYLG
jgi:hypothetical protein